MAQQRGLIGELWAFMRVRKKFWLLPILIVLLMVGALLVFAQGSALAPFIYTISFTAMRTPDQTTIAISPKPYDEEIDVHGLTHIGKVRKENQDHFLLATVQKRVGNVLATNLGPEQHLPLGRISASRSSRWLPTE